MFNESQNKIYKSNLRFILEVDNLIASSTNSEAQESSPQPL